MPHQATGKTPAGYTPMERTAFVALGIRSLPAVVIDGTLADCCAGRGPDQRT
jgi:hypothetical protein